jgi:hypothetical protein
MVGGDGRVYEGRGWAWPPRLTSKTNQDALKSILIGFIGTYRGEVAFGDELNRYFSITVITVTAIVN